MPHAFAYNERFDWDRSGHRTTRQELNVGRIGGAVYIAPLTLRSRSAKMLLSGETEFRVNRGDDYRLPFD